MQTEVQLNPEVSVVMPARNAASNIGAAIESVLTQTFHNLELVIVYDLSDDETLSIAQKYAAADGRVRIIKNRKQKGISYSRNLGVAVSKAPFIATMDSDDLSATNRIAEQLSFLKKNKQIGVVGSAITIIDEAGRKIADRRYPKEDCDIRRNMFKHSPFAHPTTMFRKSVLDKAGLYDSSLIVGEDIDLFFRIGQFAKFANLGTPLLKYRMYYGSSSNRQLRLTTYSTIRIRASAALMPCYKITMKDVFVNILSLFLVLLPNRATLKWFNMIRNDLYVQ